MNMFSQIRHYYDVSAPFLAHLANIPYDTMRSIMIGRRFPKLEPLWVFIKLEQALSLDKPVEELTHAREFLAQQEQSRQEIYSKEIRKLERTLVRRQELLEDLLALRDRLLRGFHASTELLQKGDLTTHEEDWHQMRESQIKGKLTEEPLINIPKIEAKIAGLEAELEVLRGGGRWLHNVVC